jgi:hypothetical protein
MTTLSSATGQYFTTVGCLHALTETVNGFTATDVRLVGSFLSRHCFTFFLLQIGFLSLLNKAPSLLLVKGTAKVRVSNRKEKQF